MVSLHSVGRQVRLNSTDGQQFTLAEILDPKRWVLYISRQLGEMSHSVLIEEPEYGEVLYNVLVNQTRTPQTYAPDERRPPQASDPNSQYLYSEGYPGKANTKWGDGPPSPGTAEHANAKLIEELRRELEVKEEQLKFSKETLDQALLIRDEKELQLRTALTKVDSLQAAIRHLVPYREFFDVIKRVAGTD